MPPTKKGTKTKQKASNVTNSSQESEPPISELSQDLEKRARKSPREAVPTDTAEPSTSSPPSRVLRAPESLSQELIQEMRCEIQAMKKHRQEQNEEMLRIKAKMSAKVDVDFPWKKDGNRKQAEIMHKVLDFAHQAKVEYATNSIEKGEARLDGLISTANERLKILKIADTSPYGWSTVSEYESNPIMANDEDDKRLRKAKKSAQEKQAIKAQEPKDKQVKYSGNSYRGYGSDNSRNDNQYHAYGGFKNNNPYKQSTVVPDKSQPRRNTNNDICYNCGSRGHWANACLEKKAEEPSPK